ncbi:DnaJ-domain-containing protein [Rhizophagus irregularis]|uniref:DnaJ-domain-containing protein n=1 Tax=Rhizophagus irregularis TaxID=588596 RepID=A0A2I1GJX1_9GLOM|nr:DnaJ-domain-containing protein [Rhizophagus irregularis]
MPYKVLPIPRLFFTKCIIYNKNVILTRVYSISSISSSKKHDRRYVTTNDKLKDWATIPSPTPFDIFALPKTASDEEIKSRYYELVKIYHPDKNCDKSPERFRKIVKAYEILNNKHKKEMYLRFGVGWDSPTVITAATSSNVSNRSRFSNHAYYREWKEYDDTYKGEFSKTERFMSNPYFAAFVITATLFGVAIQYMRLESSMGWIRAAEERHHLKAAHYLASAKRESQLFGKRKKAEMMLDLLHTNGVKDQNVCNSASILNSLIE